MPDVNDFKGLGHRGHLFYKESNFKISRLWLDSPLSIFSVFSSIRLTMKNVTHLVVNIGSNLSILNNVARIKWPSLNCMCLLTETVFETKATYLKWNFMPKLKHILIGSPCGVFPLCIMNLPLRHIDELTIANGLDKFTHSKEMWIYNFLCLWPSIRITDLKILRLHFVVPSYGIETLVRALNVSDVQLLYLIPCSVEQASLILVHTNVILNTVFSGLSVRWNFLKYVYTNRLFTTCV